MADMPGVRLIVQFEADTKETADAALAELAERCKRVQKEPGCIQFEGFRSLLRPEAYVLLEHWASKEDLAVHAQTMVGNPPPRASNIKRTREDYEYAAT
jgi:quinol monooxygenase YgiN